MEPIEEYLRQLHKKNSPDTTPSEPKQDPVEIEPATDRRSAEPSLADAPTSELPAVVARLRDSGSRTKRQNTPRPPEPVRRRSTRPAPRRFWGAFTMRPDVVIIGVGVVAVLVIVGLAFFPRGSHEPVSSAPAPPSPSASPTSTPAVESAHDAVIRLCNERALAYSTTDEDLLRSLTVENSPARKAENFADLSKFRGVDVRIDATDIDVVEEGDDSATVTATVTVHPDERQRLTLTLKRVDGQWRVWEVTDTHLGEK